MRKRPRHDGWWANYLRDRRGNYCQHYLRLKFDRNVGDRGCWLSVQRQFDYPDEERVVLADDLVRHQDNNPIDEDEVFAFHCRLAKGELSLSELVAEDGRDEI